MDWFAIVNEAYHAHHIQHAVQQADTSIMLAVMHAAGSTAMHTTMLLLLQACYSRAFHPRSST
jgi:hypothetical protein